MDSNAGNLTLQLCKQSFKLQNIYLRNKRRPTFSIFLRTIPQFMILPLKGSLKQLKQLSLCLLRKTLDESPPFSEPHFSQLEDNYIKTDLAELF